MIILLLVIILSVGAVTTIIDVRPDVIYGKEAENKTASSSSPLLSPSISLPETKSALRSALETTNTVNRYLKTTTTVLPTVFKTTYETRSTLTPTLLKENIIF